MKRIFAIILSSGFILLNLTSLVFAQTGGVNIPITSPNNTESTPNPFEVNISGSTFNTNQLPTGTQCVNIGYPINTSGGCNLGDIKTECSADPNKYRCIPQSVAQTVTGYVLAFDIPCQTIAGGQCPKLPESGPAGYIARIYQFGLMVVGLLAFAGIIYGSFKYILSAGNLASLEDAKEQITQAIYGLLLLLSAFIILYTINPELVQLRNPNAPIINIGELIKKGQYQGGQGQSLTSGTGAGGDLLCSAGSYTGLSLRVAGTEQLPSFTCTQCVNGASEDQSGKCQCVPGFSYSNDKGYCDLTENITREANQAAGDAACANIRGVCQINTGQSSCASGSYRTGLCSGPTNRQCCVANIDAF